MSVAQVIIETQQTKEKEMENKLYQFGGFYFGSDGHFQLTIKTTKPSGYGYSVDLGIELTPEERQELITLLLTAPQEKN